MYKRYYDDYHSCNCTHADNGEVITPKCTNDTYRQKGFHSGGLLKESNDCCKNEHLPDIQDNDCDKKTPFQLPCEIDDLILMGILFLLLRDNDTSDSLIPLILGFVLLSDKL